MSWVQDQLLIMSCLQYNQHYVNTITGSSYRSMCVCDPSSFNFEAWHVDSGNFISTTQKIPVGQENHWPYNERLTKLTSMHMCVVTQSLTLLWQDVACMIILHSSTCGRDSQYIHVVVAVHVHKRESGETFLNEGVALLFIYYKMNMFLHAGTSWDNISLRL